MVVLYIYEGTKLATPLLGLFNQRGILIGESSMTLIHETDVEMLR